MPDSRPALVVVGGREMVGIWISDDRLELDARAAHIQLGEVITVDGATWAVIGRKISMKRRGGELGGQQDIAVTLHVSARE